MTAKFGPVCFGRKAMTDEVLNTDSQPITPQSENPNKLGRTRFGQLEEKTVFRSESGTSRLRRRIICMKLLRRQRRKGCYHDQFWTT